MAAAGLHIWNNNFKSMLLLAGFPFLFLLMLFAIGALGQQSLDPVASGLDAVTTFWPFVTAGVSLWFLIAWLFHQSMINKATGAHPMERQQNPRPYNLLENLCISRGIIMPKLFIIDSPALNAFASGIDQKTYAITLTTGIMEALNDQELEAVIAHELSHIRNRDVRLLIIAVIFVGMISFFSEMMFRSMRYSRGGGKKDARLLLVAGAVLAVGYLFAIVIRFALSRKREFLADAGAVELTKNPDAMVAALQKISGRAKIVDMPHEVAQMCIENPPGFFSLFATHPPIEKRITALVENAGATLNPETVTMQDPTTGKTSMPWGKTPSALQESPWAQTYNPKDSGTV